MAASPGSNSDGVYVLIALNDAARKKLSHDRQKIKPAIPRFFQAPKMVSDTAYDFASLFSNTTPGLCNTSPNSDRGWRRPAPLAIASLVAA
jgi:hypothetical protein